MNELQKKLNLVCMGYDYEFLKLRDLAQRIMKDTANQIFKELFTEKECRAKIIERYETRNGRLMNEDKEAIMSMSKESIDNLLPTLRPRRYDFNEVFAASKDK